MLTSCHVPLWFSGTLTTTYRGKWYYDGGVTNFIPLPPHLSEEQDSAMRGVRITCFPSASIKQALPGIEIAPGEFTKCPFSFQQMLTWAFTPPDRDELFRLASLGRRDARSWAMQMGLASSSSAQSILQQQRQSQSQQDGMQDVEQVFGI
eukprot:TRINITY_DN1529_c0_g2_i2.p2 TRINITY_DN1529_c0_g2~~TRINITY_DN1529_c0_g2_i2.p2  ORF type:complete len:150 (+),score=16.24 TRINITY_DN1529_c0_g2_i2:236-685(+)